MFTHTHTCTHVWLASSTSAVEIHRPPRVDANRWNRNPRPQLEPRITSLEKYILSRLYKRHKFTNFLGLGPGVPIQSVRCPNGRWYGGGQQRGVWYNMSSYDKVQYNIVDHRRYHIGLYNGGTPEGGWGRGFGSGGFGVARGRCG